MGQTADDALANEDPVSEPPASREQLRSRRKRDVRARTVNIKRISKREVMLGRALYPADEHDDIARPRKRADCEGGVRPCPFVSCVHHLYLDVNAKTGAIKLNFPDLEPDELAESCALDVADRGGVTLEEVGTIMNLTRERIRQLEATALAKVQASQDVTALRDFVEVGRPSKRRLPVLSPAADDTGEDAPPASGAFDVDHFAGGELDDD